jgi:type IV pilus assembly protein PilZ
MSEPKRDPTPDTSSAASGTRPATREARGSPRAARILDVFFVLEEGGEPFWAVSRNISLGGAFVETKEPAPFGATIGLVIILPTQAGSIRAECVVRWVNAEGMGVQFAPMGARETHELMKLLVGL